MNDLFDLKEKGYKFVYPKYNTSYLVTLRIKELQLQLKSIMVTVPIVKDSEEVSDREILIGKTNRIDVNNFSSVNDYIIKPYNQKLIIDGGSVQAIIRAIDFLAKLIDNGDYVIEKTISATCEDTTSKVGDYNLVLLDNFDENALNERWSAYTRNNQPERYKNKENDIINYCYRSENNICVKDGKLYQKITKEDTNVLVGAKMTTGKSFWFRYGYTEVSMKIASGLGLGSGFWLHGDNSREGNKYCEFDIVEIYGNPVFNRFSPITWIAGKGKNVSVWYLGQYKRPDTRIWLDNYEKLSDEYHTFGLEWDEDYYRFTMDGEVVFENKYTDWDNKERIPCYHQPVHVILSINGGNFDWERVEPDSGNADFSNDNWTNDNVQSVDYLMVYQKDDQVNGKSAKEVISKIR